MEKVYELISLKKYFIHSLKNHEMKDLLKIALGLGTIFLGAKAAEKGFETIKSSSRLAKYQYKIKNLPKDKNPTKTINKILNEIEPKDKTSFEIMLKFHAKEALDKGNIGASSLYSSYERYIRES